jgi:hypothetical protein
MWYWISLLFPWSLYKEMQLAGKGVLGGESKSCLDGVEVETNFRINYFSLESLVLWAVSYVLTL